MDYSRHYEELTEDIRFNGLTPAGNSLPQNKVFLAKPFKKIINDSELNIDSFMNIIFDKPQDINLLETHKWTLESCSLDFDVYVIETKTLFMKGRKFWIYSVGIIE